MRLALIALAAWAAWPCGLARSAPRASSRIAPRARTMPLMSTATPSYSAEDITVLEGLEPVRKRPGMYIGSTGPSGLHHLVYEVVDNSVDEALAGHCTCVLVVLQPDGSVSVEDDGRGIPCDTHAKTGRSALETVMTVLHAGGKFGDAGYAVSGGLHGVGVSVVNALSERCVVEVRRGGFEHRMEFSRGKVTSPITRMPIDAADRERPAGTGWSRPRPSGTRVTFTPDVSIFKESVDFDTETLARRFDQLAYLNAGLVIELLDRRQRDGGVAPAADGADAADSVTAATGAAGTAGSAEAGSAEAGSAEAAEAAPPVRRFVHEGGIIEMVNDLCGGGRKAAKSASAKGEGGAQGKRAAATSPPLLAPEPISIRSERRGVQVDIALQWAQSAYSERLLSFANGIHTPAGGTHVDGLKASLTRVVNACLKRALASGGSAGAGGGAGGAPKAKGAAPKVKGAKEVGNLAGEYIREGLTAVISVKLSNPEFEGQTKSKLGSSEVRSAVDSAVSEALTAYFDFQPKVLAAITAKAIAAARAAEAAKAARDLMRSKSVMHRTVLPGKLSDCSSDDPTTSELFLVEGDSAGGSAKQGRDRRNQAILPLRGKILNIEKVDEKRLYQNTEIQSLVTSLGLGTRGEPLSRQNLRYHRVIVMTDADVDGAHIRTLLLTFFYRYVPELLLDGHVYVACPPLYKVAVGRRNYYCSSDEEADALMQKHPKASLQRFKGLGEMMPNELWRTTMDPTQRTLKQMSVVDAQQADSVFTTLMGENVASRKHFIESNAHTIEEDAIDV